MGLHHASRVGEEGRKESRFFVKELNPPGYHCRFRTRWAPQLQRRCVYIEFYTYVTRQSPPESHQTAWFATESYLQEEV